MSSARAVRTAKRNPAPEVSGPEIELAHRALYYMRLMREVEDRIERRLYRQGKVLGGVYVGRGQEAIPVGVGLAAIPEDVFLPSHRDMAIFMLRGVTAREVFAQYMGRVGGLTQGRDGNMHMGDLNRHLIAIISSLAATVPVAAGVALALRYKGSPGVVFCHFGDGSTSRGDWHEGVNFAAVQKLPVVFVCNNNQYAYSTPLHLQMACANVADRGPAYAIAAGTVDGNDVFAVHEAALRAADHARQGQGPYLLECKTFRMTGHSAHDSASYVPRELFEEWAKRDPIEQLERRMLSAGWATSEELDQSRVELLAEVEEALAWAEQSPFPDPDTLTAGVYDEERP
jgi:TPP-dependent pyruvate/acetoin dehydrogenase alpha subunit